MFGISLGEFSILLAFLMTKAMRYKYTNCCRDIGAFFFHAKHQKRLRPVFDSARLDRR
jgi:hypothetical protein